MAVMTQNQQLQDCIDTCTECHQVCLATAAHCLAMGGEHASPKHQATLHDCAQMCATSADFMVRQSPMHGMTCATCAEACRRCADECERMAQGDAMMQQCAELCRRCQQSCEAMAHKM